MGLGWRHGLAVERLQTPLAAACQRLAVLGRLACPVLLECAEPPEQRRPRGRLLRPAASHEAAILAVALQRDKVHGGVCLQPGLHRRILATQAALPSHAEGSRNFSVCKTEVPGCSLLSSTRRGQRLRGGQSATEDDGLQALQEEQGEDVAVLPDPQQPPHGRLCREARSEGGRAALAVPTLGLCAHGIAQPRHYARERLLEGVAVHRSARASLRMAHVEKYVRDAVEGC
mmetsp:Transcript_82116/g.254933  ORF Transcript_82116/g.254933 Transcript_82116/m.254933 type:complete len:230 (+) Transcript_82116:1207-1896(+)